jgi:hypothetical protein
MGKKLYHVDLTKEDEDNLSSHKKHNLYKVFTPERARSIIGSAEKVIRFTTNVLFTTS